MPNMVLVATSISVIDIIIITVGLLVHVTGFIIFMIEVFQKIDCIYHDQMKLIFVDNNEYIYTIIGSLLKYAKVNYRDFEDDANNYQRNNDEYKRQIDKLRCETEFHDAFEKIFFKSRYMAILSSAFNISKIYMFASNLYYLIVYMILLAGTTGFYFYLSLPVIILVFTNFINIILWNIAFFARERMKSNLQLTIQFISMSFFAFLAIFAIQTIPVFVIVFV